jgi:hypothetical protein
MTDPSGYFAGDEDQPQTACQPDGSAGLDAEPSPLPVQKASEFAGGAEDVTHDPPPGGS